MRIFFLCFFFCSLVLSLLVLTPASLAQQANETAGGFIPRGADGTFRGDGYQTDANREFFNATRTREESGLYWTWTGGEQEDMDFKKVTFYRLLFAGLIVICWFLIFSNASSNQLIAFCLMIAVLTLHWSFIQFEIAQGVVAMVGLSFLTAVLMSLWLMLKVYFE